MFKNKFNLVKYGIWLILFCIGFLFIYKPLTSVHLSLVLDTLRHAPFLHMCLLFIGGLMVVSLTTLYDLIVCHAFKLNLKDLDIFKISWIASAAINFAEYDDRRKGSLRYHLYCSEGVDSQKALFLDSLKNMLLFNTDGALPITFRLNFLTRAKLMFSVTLRWTITGLFFCLIFKLFEVPFDLLQVLLVFGFSIFISTISLVPYGLGIFELVSFILLHALGYSPDDLVLVLITFRIFYSLIPWILTLFILALGPSENQKSKLNKGQKQLVNLLSVKSFASLIFFSGILLIISASLPEETMRLSLIHQVFSFESVNAFRISTMGAGLILLILSKGIWDKVSFSYSITLFTLVTGSLLALLKGLNIEVACLLILIAFLLAPAKQVFYRKGSTLQWKKVSFYFVCTTTISLLYVLIYNYFTQFNPSLVFKSISTFHIVDTVIFLLFMLVSACLLNALSIKRTDFIYPTDEDLEELKSFLTQYEGNAMTHLLFLKDKCFFYTLDKQVLIAYRPYKDKLMVLGDPIGNPKLFKEAINNFRQFADQYDMIPIFYEITEDKLPIYHENGFKFLKLGEEAVVDLKEFTLAGKKGAPLRTIKNKMNRGELTFELLNTPLEPELMTKLHHISELWLDGRSEKEFSLGAFDEDYINLAPVGIIKVEDEIVGFATIMPMYNKHTISLDLMRLIPNPPNGAMDALFIGLIEWAISEQYDYFILGKAPLSNVGMNQFSTTKEKVAKYIYHYGNKIYSFKGLRKYKEKFYPEWKSSYLAYPKDTHLPSALIQLTKMISGSKDDK
ncbi:bifunctional lysylphosphatidylglycerol flippase/synthetase MprF [Niameybacter massiliensis]|uniref:Bifunctional lysylphosphatidylglycerol flippase/synthetase MprF n=1 Tax=Holtiella tumoricola TaxID=3018743 RepID=A0AA42DK56_9FIRM|nr:bifunctional lysylphosphatidylglycerol flippase/synthetase MprF [Niameybacter massiliensis]MDA3730521.1 bifunctional lysylphosphatidylglycerol flippase/synthetase MprF [Holtiella tumoricola]